MGVSTNGLLFFGVEFEEGFEFPWDAEEFEGDEEEWWRSVGGWVAPFEPFDERGEYAEGFTKGDPRVGEYFDLQSKWESSHPMPIEIVNICSDDCPIYALAVAGAVTTARRGYPVRIVPAELVADPAPLLAFCEKYGIELENEPRWLLASYWG